MQSEESYASIPDPELRESVKLAVARAGELDWPLFIALSYQSERQRVDCFDASLPDLLSEFLSGCARYAFASWPSQEVFPDGVEKPIVDFGSVRDAALRGAIERFRDRAFELGLTYSLNLWPVPKVHTGQLLYFRMFCLWWPGDVDDHLDRCFEVAMFAKLKISPLKPKLN